MKKVVIGSDGIITYVDLTDAEIAEMMQHQLSLVVEWAHKDRSIRVMLSDADYLALLIDYPQFAMIRQTKQIPVEQQSGGNYLYLEELYSDDKVLLEYFGGVNCIEFYKY